MNFNDFIKIKSVFKINELSGEVLDYAVDKNEIKGVFGVNGTYYKDDLAKSYPLSEEIPFNFIFSDNNFIVNDVDCVNLEYEVVDGRGVEINFDVVLNYDENISIDEVSSIGERSDDKIVLEDEVLDNIQDVGDDFSNLQDEDKEQDTQQNDIDESVIIRADELQKERVVNIELDDDNVKLEDRHDEIIEKQNSNDDGECQNELKVESSEKFLEEVKEEITQTINEKLAKTLSYKEDNLPTYETFLSRIDERKTTVKICYYSNDQDLEKICQNNNVSLNHVFATNSHNDINKTRRIIINE